MENKNMLTFKKWGLMLFFLLFFSSFQTLQAADETTTEELIDNEFQGSGVAQGLQDDDGSMLYSLPFGFDFYGVSYDEIWIGINGVICFGDESYDEEEGGMTCAYYEYLLDDEYGPMVFPLHVDLRTDVNPSNDIYITENSDNVVIRWDAVDYGNEEQINFEVILYENGNIKFNYGDQVAESFVSGGPGDPPVTVVGISKGDGSIYTASAYNGYDNFNQLQTSAWGDFEIEQPEEELVEITVIEEDCSSSIGNTIWLDLNSNGIQESNESGLNNIRVKLLDDKKRVVERTDTNHNGHYKFENLCKGDYKVVVKEEDTQIYKQTFDPTGSTMNNKATVHLEKDRNDNHTKTDFGFSW